MFRDYKPKPGDTFDFSEFDNTPVKGKIIRPVFDELRHILESSEQQAVTVLTARGRVFPVKSYLAKRGIKNVKIIALGSTDPNDKAMYIQDRLISGNYVMVRLFEDDRRNISSIKDAVLNVGIPVQVNRVISDNKSRFQIKKKSYKPKGKTC